MHNMIIYALLAFFFISPLQAQEIEMKDLSHLSGLYTGELSYLDFNSDDQVTVKLISNCYTVDDTLKVDITINEFNETHHHTMQAIIRDGKLFFPEETKIISKEIDYQSQMMNLIIETKGIDGPNHKACTLRYLIEAGINDFNIKKMVKYDDENAFFKRNEYRMKRY